MSPDSSSLLAFASKNCFVLWLWAMRQALAVVPPTDCFAGVKNHLRGLPALAEINRLAAAGAH